MQDAKQAEAALSTTDPSYGHHNATASASHRSAPSADAQGTTDGKAAGRRSHGASGIMRTAPWWVWVGAGLSVPAAAAMAVWLWRLWAARSGHILHSATLGLPRARLLPTTHS